MENERRCSYWRCANRVGLLLVALFVFCFLWYYLRPVEQELHLKLLRMSYFGFNDMGGLSFILGAVQTYIWGYIAVGIWWLLGCCFNCKVKPNN